MKSHMAWARAEWIAGAASLLSLPAYAQTLGQATSHEISIWRVVGALLFCCLLGAAGALALKYRMKNQRGRAKPAFDMRAWRDLIPALAGNAKTGGDEVARLQVIETVHLSYQVDVSLLECDGVSVMLVTSPHGAFVVNREAAAKMDLTK